MADDILAKEGAQTPRIDTLSCYDNTEPSGDDWVYFQKIEGKRGRPGVHIDASKMESSGAPLQPAEFSSLPGYLGFGRELEAKRAATVQGGGYRVVLSGIGGDEFTGGVPNPIPLLADLIVQCKYVSLAKELMAWSLVKRRPWIQLFGQAFLDLVPTSVRQYVASQAKLEPWIEKRFAKKTNLVWQLLDVKEHFGLWLPARRSLIAGVVMMANKMAKYALPSQALEEISYPFLDQDLIEFVLVRVIAEKSHEKISVSMLCPSAAALVPYTRTDDEHTARHRLV